MSELVIKISGDLKNYKDSLKQVEKSTEGLGDTLAETAKISAVAFAALSAEVGFSVHAYAEQEEASNKLTAALKHQGIYSRELFANYREQADALQKLTGVDDDAIVKGQALVQGYLGQIQVTEELTTAVLNFATTQKMDVESAFALVGKSISGSVNALARYGIEVDSNSSKQEKMAAIIQGLNVKFEGQAAAVGEGLGVYKILGKEISDLQEAMGKRFAPAATAAGKALVDFVSGIKDNKPVVDFLVSMITAGVVVGGLGLVVATAGMAFLKLKAALAAAQVATTAMSIATKGLVAATGLGLLVIIATEIYLNWSSIWPRMQAGFQAFVNNIGTLGQGLATLLKGVFTLDVAMIKEGLAQAQSAFTDGFKEYQTTVAAKNQEAKAALKEQDQADRDEQVEIQEQRRAEDQERQDQENARKVAGAQETALNERSAQIAYNEEKKNEQIKSNNTYLLEQQKYGKAYATVNREIRDSDVGKSATYFATMQDMQRSQNSTLRSIGKAAAITQITMDTARGATQALTAFPIPFVGPALGMAAAAAIIAFGAERIGTVTAAADGGLLSGGIPGKDSINLLGMPGEVVVPTRNFDELIDSVAQRRGYAPPSGDVAGGGGIAHVILELKGDLMNFIEAKLVERERLGLSLQGA